MEIEDVDPLGVFAGAAEGSRDYWETPTEGMAMCGVGQAWRKESEGAVRFQTVQSAWHDITRGAIREGPSSALGVGPLLIGGFAFEPEAPRSSLWDGFPAGRFILPEFSVARGRETSWLTINGLIGSDDDVERLTEVAARAVDMVERTLLIDGAFGAPPLSQDDIPPRNQWEGLVGEALSWLAGDELRKVVLARRVDVNRGEDIDVPAVLFRLRLRYPECCLFATDHGGAVFLAASPERLASVRNGKVQAPCIAGSAVRGGNEREDGDSAAALLNDPKNLHEHNPVVSLVRDRLAPLCHGLDVPARPGILTLRNVHHLFTPIEGTPLPGVTILDVVRALHPTPAVSGVPVEAALDFIREHEGIDRGWYAGGFGWINAAEDGDFAVALRSGLVEANRAHLFAGCGIVAESEPDSEWSETLVKLQPILTALGPD